MGNTQEIIITYCGLCCSNTDRIGNLVQIREIGLEKFKEEKGMIPGHNHIEK